MNPPNRGQFVGTRAGPPLGQDYSAFALNSSEGMGLSSTDSKDNLTLKLLSLSPSEMEELFQFLFRKLGYRVLEVARKREFLTFHLTQETQDSIHHALAYWAGGQKAIPPDFLIQFFKNTPFTLPPGTKFERGFLFSPYEFAALFKTEAEKNKISLVSGETLSELLTRHELTYYFPSFLESLGKLLWKRLPLVIAPLLLVYGFLVYQTFKPQPPPSMNQPRVEKTEPVPSAGPQVSLITPTFSVHIEPADELYSRMEKLSGSSPQIKETPNRNELPPTPELKQPREEAPPNPPASTRPPPPPAVRKTPPTPRLSPRTAGQPKTKENPYKIIYKYNRVVDLEEKYYSIARDLEKKHFNAKAKIYYQKVIQVAPDGDYADQARAALKRL